MKKIKVLFVYNNLGIGGISKALVDLLNLLDYSRYDVTLYIRRDDVLDLIEKVPSEVNTITVKSEVKNVVFENNVLGRVAKFVYNFLKKKHKHIAKQFFLFYKCPIQRKKEKTNLKEKFWDVAVSYSTDGDDPIFVNECINAEKKYIFVHQSTKIAQKNVNAMKKYNGIISVNPMLVPWVSSLVKSPKKVYDIENYMDYEKVKILASEKITVPAEKTVISTCGRLCPTKGFDYVAQAAKSLSEKGHDFVWYWIGDGPSRKEMEQLICEYNISDKFVITGFLKNPYPYIGASDIYVQPSRAECLSLSMIEALVLEKPVITTKTASGKYLFQKYGCGILIDESPDMIVSEVERLLSGNDAFVSEKEKAKAINWEKEKERYLNSWNNLLNGNLQKSSADFCNLN